MADGVGDQADVAASSGLSAFVAKVLNQLSLSAWLPAAVLAASVTMLAEFWSHRSLSVGTAIEAITHRPGPILILVLPVLILATMLTQAFSFAAIRVLEGYWVRRGPITWLRTGLIRYQVHHRLGVAKRRKKAAARAFSAVRSQLLTEYSYAVVGALELQAIEARVPELDDAADRKAYANATWRDICKPWHLSKVDQLDRQLTDYPELPNRVMPTKLGNIPATN